MKNREIFRSLLVAGCLLMAISTEEVKSQSKGRTALVVGRQAAELEKFAAGELQRYLKKLYKMEPVVTTPDNIPASDYLFLIGRPETNGAVREATQNAWPKLTDQGFLIRSVTYRGQPGLVLGGGSQTAVLWSTYDLLERLGLVYTLDGDIFPDPPGRFEIPHLDVAKEPVFSFRGWRVWNVHAMGPESWGIQEQNRVIDQLVKMKFNAVVLYLWPFQPFVHYQFRGIHKKTGDIFFGLKYPLGPGTVGADKFGTATEFQNPDFAGARNYEERLAAGRKLAHGILSYAKSRGMKTVLGFSLISVPIEFKQYLADLRGGRKEAEKTGKESATYKRIGNHFYGTDRRVNEFRDAFDPVVQELAQTVLQAHLREYPEADYYAIGSSEQRDSVAGYEKAWKLLDQRYQLEKDFPLEQLLAHARNRNFHGPGRAERELKGDIEFVYFLDKLFNQDRLLEKVGSPSAHILLEGNMQDELYPVLPRVFPNFGFLTGIDYTLSLSSNRFDLFSAFPDYPVLYKLTLNDDNNAILIQHSGDIVETALNAMRRYSVNGYMMRFWLLGDIDPDAAYVSAASWAPGLRTEEYHRRRYRAICGENALPEAMAAFRVLQEATVYTDTILGFGFPVPEVVKRHFQSSSGAAAKLEPAIQYFERALALIQQARAKSRPAGRQYLNYFAGRLECGSQYMQLILTMERLGLAYREALKAKAQGSVENAYAKISEIEELSRKARAFSTASLQAYGAVARDQSDRGLLATMNHYVHRYVLAQLHLLELEISAWSM